jgi:hypothetical protein
MFLPLCPAGFATLEPPRYIRKKKMFLEVAIFFLNFLPGGPGTGLLVPDRGGKGPGAPAAGMAGEPGEALSVPALRCVAGVLAFALSLLVVAVWALPGGVPEAQREHGSVPPAQQHGHGYQAKPEYTSRDADTSVALRAGLEHLLLAGSYEPRRDSARAPHQPLRDTRRSRITPPSPPPSDIGGNSSTPPPPGGTGGGTDSGGDNGGMPTSTPAPPVPDLDGAPVPFHCRVRGIPSPETHFNGNYTMTDPLNAGLTNPKISNCFDSSKVYLELTQPDDGEPVWKNSLPDYLGAGHKKIVLWYLAKDPTKCWPISEQGKWILSGPTAQSDRYNAPFWRYGYRYRSNNVSWSTPMTPPARLVWHGPLLAV